MWLFSVSLSGFIIIIIIVIVIIIIIIIEYLQGAQDEQVCADNSEIILISPWRCCFVAFIFC